MYVISNFPVFCVYTFWYSSNVAIMSSVFAVILFLVWICVRILVSNILVGYCLPCILSYLCDLALYCGLRFRHIVDVFCRESRP